MDPLSGSTPLGQPAEGVTPPLTGRVVRGGAWAFGGKLISRGLQMIKLAVLARLLVPDDFGLFGIVTLALAALETFTQTGFQTALIQQKGDTDAYLDTAWTVQLLRGLVLAGALFVAAPVVGWFFQEPRAVPLVRFLSLVEVFNGLTNIGVIYFQKELAFHRQVAYQVLSSTVAVVVGIILAWQLRNVWALVWGYLAGQVASTVLSYFLHPYRPRFRWDPTQARGLFGFGKWMLGTSMMVYAGGQIDNLLVGRMLGTTALGFYGTAYNLSLVPLRETTYVGSSVLLPSYAKLQDEPTRLRTAYERALAVTGLFAIPACVGMIVLAWPIVHAVLGDQWLAAAPIIQILASAQLIKSVVSTGSAFFIGVGVPQYEFNAQVARVVGLAACIVPAVLLWGVEGAALSVVVSAVCMFAVYFDRLARLLDRPAGLVVAALLPSLAGAATMAAALLYPAALLRRYTGPPMLQLVLLIGTVLVGAAIHGAVCWAVCLLHSQSTLPVDIRSLWSSLRRIWAARVLHRGSL